MTLRLTIVSIALLAAAAVQAQPLSSIRQAEVHYLAADYEAALRVLAVVPEGEEELAAAERLRAFCLLALGRTADADAPLTRAVVAQPDWEPGADVSPRMRLAVRAVRDRVLPARARALYTEGRSALDRGDAPAAAERLTEAVRLLEVLAREGRQGMDDLRVLADGFLALASARLPRVEETPAPVTSRAWTYREATYARAVDRERMDMAGDAEETLTPADERVAADAPDAAPAPLRQDLPPWAPGPGSANGVFRGAVDVAIDATGVVTWARVASSVHPLYDAALLDAAMRWRYVPARRDGQPVPARKRVEVVLRPR